MFFSLLHSIWQRPRTYLSHFVLFGFRAVGQSNKTAKTLIAIVCVYLSLCMFWLYALHHFDFMTISTGKQIAYMAFLMLFSYTVLVRMGPTPTWQEAYSILYITTLGCEKVREVISSEPVAIT